MWAATLSSVLLLGLLSQTVNAGKVRGLRFTESSKCGDLICMKEQYEEILKNDGYLYLPPKHEENFGRHARIKVDRLMIFMGLLGSDHQMHNVDMSLSKNNLQLRIVGFYDLTDGLASYNVSRAETGYIRLEHIYTLEEQGHIQISVGAILAPRWSMPEITLDTAAKVIAKDHKVKFPRSIRFVQDWNIFELGVVGGHRSEIYDNTDLVRYGMDNIGFKHKIEFGKFSGFLKKEDLKKSIIKLLCKVQIPLLNPSDEYSSGPTANTSIPLFFEAGDSVPFDCSVVSNPLARKLCTRAMRKGSIEVHYDLVRGFWEPYILLGFDVGYGDNAFSHFYNSFYKGQKLSVAIHDIELGKNLKIGKASFFVKFSPSNAFQLGFGLQGSVALTLFKQKINFKSTVKLPITGAGSIKLESKGVVQLLWKLPIWIGNLKAGAKLFQGNLPVGGALAAEINLGWAPTEKDGDTRLKGMALVSFDATSISDTYLYAKFNPITIQSLINMFLGHKRFELPSFLGSTGISGLDERHGRVKPQIVYDSFAKGKEALLPEKFPQNPEQFIAVFTAIALQTDIVSGLDHSAIMQPGLTVIGQVNVLGVAAKTYARVDYMHLGMELDLTLDPVILGNGLVKLTAANVVSERIPTYMQSRGPNIYVAFQLLPDFNKWPAPEVRMSGALEVFGVRVALDVELSRYGFHFKTELNIWDWFVAKCIIEVKSYDKGLQNGARVYGELTIGSLKQLSKGFFNKVLKKLASVFFWKRLHDGKDADIIDRDGRRRLGLRKFGESLKKLGKKIFSPITKATLLSVKFDLNNANPDSSIPVFTEFAITIFGKHLIRYKSKKHVLHFGNQLNDAQEDSIAQETINDLDDCLADCEIKDQTCIDRVKDCQNLNFEPISRPDGFDDDNVSDDSGGFIDRDASIKFFN